MSPSTTITTEIARGKQFDGFAFTCYKDTAQTIESDLSGCTAAMRMGHARTEDYVDLTCSIDSNIITVGPLTASETSDLQLGVYLADLIITWPGSIPRGPYVRVALTVKDTITP